MSMIMLLCLISSSKEKKKTLHTVVWIIDMLKSLTDQEDVI